MKLQWFFKWVYSFRCFITLQCIASLLYHFVALPIIYLCCFFWTDYTSINFCDKFFIWQSLAKVRVFLFFCSLSFISTTTNARSKPALQMLMAENHHRHSHHDPHDESEVDDQHAPEFALKFHANGSSTHRGKRLFPAKDIYVAPKV